MTTIYIDTNIYLDFLLSGRPKRFAEEAFQLLKPFSESEPYNHQAAGSYITLRTNTARNRFSELMKK